MKYEISYCCSVLVCHAPKNRGGNLEKSWSYSLEAEAPQAWDVPSKFWWRWVANAKEKHNCQLAQSSVKKKKMYMVSLNQSFQKAFC